MLYFITGNKGKFEEVKQIIPNIEQMNIDLDEIQEINAQKVIAHKLQEAFKHQKDKQSEFIVEDTSLYLDALNGLPGPLIKWFMKTIGNEGLVKIAEKFQNSKATAKTMIGYAKSPEKIKFFEGAVEGKIVVPAGGGWFWLGSDISS